MIIDRKLMIGMALGAGLLAAQAADADSSPLETSRDKVSYSIGLNIGNNLKRQSVDVDLELLEQGLRDAYSGADALLTDEQVREVMTKFQEEMRAEQQKQRSDLGEKNKAEGEAFLAENKEREGVVTRPSGLQYEVITAGTGKSPSLEDQVVVHYRGTLLDGTEFDSSYKRGQPMTFSLKGVIAGWTEALPLMREGAKWKLYVPSDLAYKEFGSRSGIGPNATLIFEVELIEVKEKKPVTSDIIKVPSAEELKKGAKIEIIKPDQIEKK